MIRPINRTWKEYGGKCKVCHGPNDPYMVTFELWFKVIGHRNGGLVCLECFEQKLGRELVREDFLHDLNRHGDPCPINYGFFGFHVDQFLKSREVA